MVVIALMSAFLPLPPSSYADTSQTSQAQNTFDEAYETSEYEDDCDEDDYDGELDDDDKPKIDPLLAKKIETGFKRLSWAKESPTLLKRFLTRPIFERIRNRSTKSGGSTLLDVMQSGVANLVRKCVLVSGFWIITIHSRALLDFRTVTLVWTLLTLTPTGYFGLC